MVNNKTFRTYGRPGRIRSYRSTLRKKARLNVAKVHVSKEYVAVPKKTYEDRQRIVAFSNKHRGYVVRYEGFPVKMKTVSKDDYLRFLAGECTHIFPEYDDSRHYLDCEYDSVTLSMTPVEIPMILYDCEAHGVAKEIPPGVYRCEFLEGAMTLQKSSVSTDKYINFKDHPINLYKTFKEFQDSRDGYAAHGIRHKEGILLYGPQGTGKSHEIGTLLEHAVEDNFVAIQIPSTLHNISEIENFREPLRNRDIVFVLEELTERIGGRNGVDELLNFLDSGTSWNHSFIVATTNYPELLPKNLVDRPGRFSSLIKVNPPTLKERMRFLEANGIEGDLCRKIGELTDGKSIDYIAQCVIHHKIRGVDIYEYIKSVEHMRRDVSNEFRGRAMGIRQGEEFDE
jgi:hypothetical protein